MSSESQPGLSANEQNSAGIPFGNTCQNLPRKGLPVLLARLGALMADSEHPL